MNSGQALILKSIVRLKLKPDLPSAQWAERYRRIGRAESALIGRFSFDTVPFFKWFLDRYEDPKVKKGVCRKPAQIGWTQSVICNLLGKYIDIEHPTCIVLLPSGPAVKKFNEEKFVPLLESNPRLAKVVPIKRRDKDVKIDWKKLPGGYIKLVGSNTPDGVKSSTGARLIVEEPDDCNLNLKGQGDAIKLLEERGKTVPDLKILIGGTPTVKGVSSIDDEFELSDQNYWHVPCPDCGELQRLEWDQVRWLKDESVNDPIFGRHLPETAHYICAHCGSAWTDEMKNEAIRRGEPCAMRPFNGVVGLALNELYASFTGSRMAALAKKWLIAWREFERGDPDALVPFYNTTLGLPYEHRSDVPKEDALRARCLPYASLTVPAGGLVLTAGVDVQHNRFALIIRAWGRGEESWLVWWGEIHGNVIDTADPVWGDLEQLLFRPYRTESGRALHVSRVSIDCGDGNTSDQTYQFVRKHQARGVLAVKGASEHGAEIFSLPRKKDPNRTNTKAARYGLKVFLVGTAKAKDLLIEGRLKLEGAGPGRMHWPQDVRGDYFEQLLGEVKAPMRVAGRVKRVWTKKSGAQVEALDGEVYALHAARAMQLHLKHDAWWAQLEAKLAQVELFEEKESATGEPENPRADAAPPGQPGGADAAPVQTSATQSKPAASGLFTSFGSEEWSQRL